MQRLPIRYHTFAYRRSEFDDYHALSDHMKRDLKSLIGDHLAEFQEFDTVPIYYASSVKQTRQWRVCSEKAA
ncbi:MAG: hypothetical protein IKE22_04515 [Atopobiaceae bacterium]|nr:hypothetical protein [Atopobiaceae bacterium]